MGWWRPPNRQQTRRDSALVGSGLNLPLVDGGLPVAIVVAVPAGQDLLALGLWAVQAIVALYGRVVGVVGAVRAWRGEAWRYPVNLRVVR